MILPDDRDWADVFVGEPSPTQIFALRATPQVVPLASSVPYNIPDAFARKIRDRIGA